MITQLLWFMYNKVFVFRVPVNASIKSRHTTYSILGGIRVIREDNSACLWIKCMQFCESIPVIILVMLHAFEETANIFHKVLSQVQYNLCNQIEQIYIGLSIMYMHTSNIFRPLYANWREFYSLSSACNANNSAHTIRSFMITGLPLRSCIYVIYYTVYEHF